MRMRTALVPAAVALAAAATLATAGTAVADAEAEAVVFGSPGVLSGNNVQIPIHVQANVCGNSINLIGLLNPTGGNICINR
ncbi:chaplin [Streptomyces hebeiensis]